MSVVPYTSGRCVIYDGEGTSPESYQAAYHQLTDCVDDRSYKVEYFSKVQDINDPKNPTPLFVMPGGNYHYMAKPFQPVASKIYNLVANQGTSYLGLGAGAVAASEALLTSNRNVPYKENFIKPVKLYSGISPDDLHLPLYPNRCAILAPEKPVCYGVEYVQDTHNLSEEPYAVYFSRGVFFPSPEDSNSQSIYTYPFYQFHGPYKKGTATVETYPSQIPTAAVVHQVGKGKIVLSGVHPEIGPEVVETFSTKTPFEKVCKTATLDALNRSKDGPKRTMTTYLGHLHIGTKV